MFFFLVTQVYFTNNVFISKQIAGKKPGATNIQCPICYLFFLKDNILEHAAECDGKKAEKGIRKNTIAAAVAQSERERKKYGYINLLTSLYTYILTPVSFSIGEIRAL
jgi:hypothetical protein